MSQVLEPELEALLLRLVPNLEKEWAPAPQEILEELEDRVELTGHDFPQCHQWFMSKMGGSVGALEPSLGGFTAAKVLEAYESATVDLGPKQFLIGRMPDPLMPLDVFYDFEHPVRDDALVCRAVVEAGPVVKMIETFREYIAVQALMNHRVMTAPQRCFGAFVTSSSGMGEKLDEVMGTLGFTTPVATGSYCGLYETEDMTMVARATITPENEGIRVFHVSGPSVTAIRRLLGEIATATTFQVDADEWTPAAS
ncbi:MAG: hypothetical protein AAF799_27350 [Myxococcota bacterium]